MAVLNLANAIRLGLNPVDRVYLGSSMVWSSSFSPTRYFASGEPGLWYDPGDLSDTKLNYRRNLGTWSEGTISQRGGSNTTNASPGIPGFDNAIYFADNALQRDSWMLGTPTLLMGEAAVFSVIVKMDDGLAPDPGTAAGKDFFFYTNGAPTDPYTVTPLGDDLYRVSAPNAGGGGVTGIRKPTNGSARGFKATAFQWERGTTPSAYQRTTDWQSQFMAQYPSHALLQDQTGLSAVLGIEQPVGLTLDKRLGAGMFGTLYNPTGFADPGATFDSFSATAAGFTGTKSTAGGTDLAYSTAIVPTVVGQWFRVEVDVSAVTTPSFTVGLSSTTNGRSTSAGFTSVGPKTYTGYVRSTTTGTWSVIVSTTSLGSITVDAVRVRRVLGNVCYQGTAAARPTQGARKNAQIKSELFNDAAFRKHDGATVLANQITAPNGTLTGNKITGAATGIPRIDSYPTRYGLDKDKRITVSVYVKAGNVNTVRLDYGASYWCDFTLSGAGSMTPVGGATGTIEALANGWYRISLSGIKNNEFNYYSLWVPVGAENFVYAWGWQEEQGPVPTSYQYVNTTTDYYSVGFMQYQKFDGVDDGIVVTGPVNLGASMDFFMLVRRSSAARFVMCYDPASAGNRWFGAVESGVTSSPTGGGITGTPSYYVNGVKVPDDGTIRRMNLHDAIPLYEWAVVEVRDLNLSSFVDLGIGGYTDFRLAGDVGGVLLVPSQDAANRTLIRQYFANKAGIVLP